MTEAGETEKWEVSKLAAAELVAEYVVIEDGITYTFSLSYGKK